ncbi:MAG: alkylation response protein AidB-like acyl-CoA dehydrogenase [Arcticibacterium sp.]|jgi:alkylation response protein AidB-like acyl-CoA dehydrogenase
MDLEIFRKETRAWLKENCPESMRSGNMDMFDAYWGGRKAAFSSDDQKVWFNKMLEKGWTVPHWDKKYGGGGLNPMEHKILNDEMARIGAKKPLFSFGVSMLGPALLKFASEEQKDKYLPEIVKGEIRWCQGYSEPNAGSDLAGLQCRAEDKGDHFLINGSKVWTSYGDKADWIFCLVRTDFEVKKQSGISFILIDMETEGVTTRPIKLISGKSPFTETFYSNVKVAKANLIGDLNNGWTIAKYLLTHERQMIGHIGDTSESLKTHDLAIQSIGLENGKLADPILRKELAEYEMKKDIFDMTVERAIDEHKAGNNSGATSSLFKYYGTELNMERMELMMSLSGSEELEAESNIARDFLRSKGNSIEGGTSEIQLNIIAKNILALPSR